MRALHILVAGLVAGLLLGFAAPPYAASAAEAPYPNRVVKLVVAFPAGGPSDVMGRLIAGSLSATFGQQVIVDNRPGAGGTLAGRIVAAAEPDGYTLLLGTSGPLGIGPALYGSVGYDPVAGFVPVAMVADVPYVMIASPRAPFDTAAELIAFARMHPGKLNLGVPNGAQPHVLALMFKALAGIDIVVVPYKGGSTAMTDMMAGQIDAGFETTSVVFSQIAARSLKGLAVIGERRLPELPDTPTMIESGVPDLKGSSWSGILAPAGTPNPIVERLRAAVIAGLKSPEMMDKFARLGAQARFPSRQEFAAFIADDSRRIAAVVRAAAVKGN